MQRNEPYHDRVDAGRELARLLAGVANSPTPTVLALPRGGVPVGREVAQALGGRLDVLIVRKLGLPGQGELAMGAVAGVGDQVQVVRNEAVLAGSNVPPEAFDRARRVEVAVLRRSEARYRADTTPAPIEGREVVIVDDGVATGSTMRAAAQAVRASDPARVLVAVPIGARQSVQRLSDVADEVICAWTPTPFFAVGQGYRDFAEVTEDEVRQLLHA
jgi:predicted phosphoribosyltransferase